MTNSSNEEQLRLEATRYRDTQRNEFTQVTAACPCGRGGWLRLPLHPEVLTGNKGGAVCAKGHEAVLWGYNNYCDTAGCPYETKPTPKPLIQPLDIYNIDGFGNYDLNEGADTERIDTQLEAIQDKMNDVIARLNEQIEADQRLLNKYSREEQE